MEVYDYIKRLHQGIERVENYGYTESVEIREEIRPQKQVVINAITMDQSCISENILKLNINLNG